MRPFQTIAQIIIATSVVNCAPVPPELSPLTIPKPAFKLGSNRNSYAKLEEVAMRPLHPEPATAPKPATADNLVTPKKEKDFPSWVIPTLGLVAGGAGGGAVGLGVGESEGPEQSG
jgi:hypothetical protein